MSRAAEIQQLIEQIKRRDIDFYERDYALSQLVEIGLGATNDDTVSVEVLDAFRVLLAPDTWYVIRRLTTKALGGRRIVWAVDLLYDSLISDENTSVKYYAAEGLGRIASEDAVRLLTKALAHERKAVRVYAQNNLKMVDFWRTHYSYEQSESTP